MRTENWMERWGLVSVVVAAAGVVAMVMVACAPAAMTALDIAKGPAIEVLTKVIADRFGSGVNEATAYCEEMPRGFRSGIEELDDNERGAFVLCWGEAAE